MQLFLMRHAEAAPGFPDEKRQLTASGLASLSQMPQFLSEALAEVEYIFVSPYVRTRQTIENLLPGREYQVTEHLIPDASIELVAELLQSLSPTAKVLLVTHMPLVGQLSGWLKSGALGYDEPFLTAQVEQLAIDYPSAGLATHEAFYYLQR